MLQVNNTFSWQVRATNCFAKVVDKSLLIEGTTGIPQAVALIFIGRLLKEKEEIYINLVAGELNLTCKIRRFNNRHRLFMTDFKDYLRAKQINVGDLLIFDRSLYNGSKFYVSGITQQDSLIISPLETERLVGENLQTVSTRRVGQETFRELLLRRYEGICCLSGIRDVTKGNMQHPHR